MLRPFAGHVLLLKSADHAGRSSLAHKLEELGAEVVAVNSLETAMRALERFEVSAAVICHDCTDAKCRRLVDELARRSVQTIRLASRIEAVDEIVRQIPRIAPDTNH